MTITTTAAIAGAVAANNARMIRVRKNRKECTTDYKASKCDGDCLYKEWNFMRPVGNFNAHYQIVYHNRCNGPIPNAYEETTLSGFSVLAGIFIVLAAIFFGFFWINRESL